MIHSLKVTDPKRITTKWWADVPTLQWEDRFTFGPGLNILWGRNGSGKSTLLRLLAHWFHAYQGGKSFVTEQSCRVMFPSVLGSDDTVLDGAEVKHDGKSVVYSSPDNKIGFSGSGFDYSFIEEGIGNQFFKGSSGQSAIRDLIKSVGKTSDSKIRWEMDRKHVNDLWVRRLDAIEAMLTPNAPAGPQTMLLDEPDRSLDLDNAEGLWRGIAERARKFQLIIASHSLFAMKVKGARYIELSPGYLEGCRELLRKVDN